MELQLIAPMLGLPYCEPNELFALHALTFEFHHLGHYRTWMELAALNRTDLPVLFHTDRAGVERLSRYVESRQSKTPGKEAYFIYYRPHHKIFHWGEYTNREIAQAALEQRGFRFGEAFLIPAEPVKLWRLQVMVAESTRH